MKTYEEMTRDVFSRRDKELNIRKNRQKNVMKIGIPCVAAAGAFGFVALTVMSRGFSRDGGGVFNNELSSEMTEVGTGIRENYPFDTSLPYRDNNIVFNNGSPETVNADIYINENDFVEFTLEEMNNYYGLKIDAFSEKYPEWTMNLGKLGIYREEGDDGTVAWVSTYWQQNVLWWKLGEKEVSVEVNMGRLPVHCVVYSSGDDAVSVINNTDVSLYHFTGKFPNDEPIDKYYARFMYGGCGFEITANGTASGGITEDEFIKIVELYTNSEKMTIEPPDYDEIPL